MQFVRDLVAKVEEFVKKLDGEAVKEIKLILADLKAQEEFAHSRVATLLAQARQDVEQTVSQVSPEVAQAARDLVAKLESDVHGALSGDTGEARG